MKIYYYCYYRIFVCFFKYFFFFFLFLFFFCSASNFSINQHSTVERLFLLFLSFASIVHRSMIFFSFLNKNLYLRFFDMIKMRGRFFGFSSNLYLKNSSSSSPIDMLREIIFKYKIRRKKIDAKIL